jgi:DNA polymerase I-like protein with 3'-5' exonuclease and polymerase domains
LKYEEYLVACRHAQGVSPPELQRIAKLTLISREIQANAHLSDWLEHHAGFITVVTDEKDAIIALDRLKSSEGLIGIDIETAKKEGFTVHPQAGLHPKISTIRLVQLFSKKDCGVVVIDCFSAGYGWLKHLKGGRYVAHNSQFESDHFWHHIKQRLDIECTMLAARVFHGELKKLSDLSAEYLQLTLSKSLQVSDWSRPVLLDEQILYACSDAVTARLLWNKFEQLFSDSDDKYRDAYNFLKALVYPVIRQAGIGFDVHGHEMVIAQWLEEEAVARKTLTDLGLFDPASVKQKQQWLHRHLTVKDMMDWPLTECGNLSTAADVLERSIQVPGAAPLARWSQLATRLANFGNKLADLVIEGELYPSYRIAAMVTGRFGCNSPNIQNQPRSGFKHLYRAPQGYQFVTGDLSQIELRVAGLISGDSAINDAYANGRDLHREVAAERAGKNPADVTKSERQGAKAINFGLIFGAGAKTLRLQAVSSYGVEMSLEEAQEAKGFFHTKYQRLSMWQQEAVADANAFGYSESPHIKLTRHYDDRVYTHAMNFPVQSGAWEVLALAIVYIDDRLPQDGSIRISHHVYDELCLVATDAHVMAAALLLRDGFLHGFQTVFKDGSTRGLVEIGAGQTWEEAGLESRRIKEASL